MSSQPIALILGSGPRIGASVAAHFARTGHLVAIVSRNTPSGKTPEGYLSIPANLSDFSCIPSIFSTVVSEFKSAPSVVVYNAASFTPPAADDLFSIPVRSLAADLKTNTVAVYAAAREAVKGWETLGDEASKVFIFTGNKQNTGIGPMMMTVSLGVGKAGSAYFIGAADGRYAGLAYR
ncbi:hypothetical protein EJ04DRAFT_515147 [Polyplosphaeria fusca]|uniref:NAD(P)-binding protein n=1 Tax=Polyplosphaeria fusca TaxID=682080 RepID=A0A9P4QTH0_9PLEO|nr:hypothetical protein EJ04DRAFT_515147 [Polyplosphaeria fusca]